MKKKNAKTSILDHGTSGIVLLPFLLWFIFSVIVILMDPAGILPIFFFSPFNAVAGILFVAILNYHIGYEMRYLVDTYVSHRKNREFYYFFVNSVSTITTVAGILAILQLHLTNNPML